MEIQTPISQTLITDNTIPSPKENLDPVPRVSPSIIDSMAVDSLDLETTEIVVEEETVCGPPQEEEDRWQSYSWSKPLSPKPTGVGAGLENLGNTCFMNAVLQCFTHTVPFVLGLRSLNHHEKPCDRDNEGFCLLCALYGQIELSLKSSGGIVSPSKFFDNLSYFSSFFERYQQEDAHEFLQCLLDRLESCCSKVKNDLSSPDDCLVKNVFGGRLVSRLRCCNCGHMSCTFEPLNDLSLEIEDVVSLPTALESFTRLEKIEDMEPKFRCENCKEQVSVEKQLMLDQAPSVATFHLKRFKTEGTCIEKIDKHVDFPLELDLKPYTIANETNNEELKYQLYAVVKHSGFRPTSGHYVCYIRSSPDTWHKMNDSRVTSVAEELVLSQEAYILLYAKQGIPWFSTTIEVQKPCGDPGIFETSPKSVLDNMDFAPNPQVKNSAHCGANEPGAVADRTSTQLPCETQFEDKIDEPCVAGVPANEILIDYVDDNPMSDASLPPARSHDSSDKATNYNGSPLTPSRSQCQNKSQIDISEFFPQSHSKDEKSGGICRKAAVNKTPEMDPERKEAMRYAKRMPNSRGAKLMALLTPPTSGKIKKRMGSSPCKRVSPRTKHSHNLMHPVPVSR